MLVYKSGRLNREVIPISKSDYILRLSHPTSGMVIETKFVSGSNSDSQRKESLFKVYKEVDGKYVIYEEFPIKNKTVTETFKDAVEFFEDKIFEALKEEPPQVKPNKDEEPQPEPNKIKEVPIIGDIVQIGNQYARVVDVNGRNITTSKLSKKEAMRILKNIKNQQISDSVGKEASLQDITNSIFEQMESGNLNIKDGQVIMEDGGEIDLFEQYEKQPKELAEIVERYEQRYADGEMNYQDTNRFLKEVNEIGYTFDYGLDNEPFGLKKLEEGGKLDNVLYFNVDDDNVQILRVSPPPQAPPEGENPPPPPPEDVPDNIKDPFQEDDENESDDDVTGGDDGTDDEVTGGDDGADDDVTGGDDDDFGQKPTKEFDIDELIDKINKAMEEGKNQDDLKLDSDIKVLENKLGTKKIKTEFRKKKLAKIGLGNQQLFATDNDERIDNALNKIFE